MRVGIRAKQLVFGVLLSEMRVDVSPNVISRVVWGKAEKGYLPALKYPCKSFFLQSLKAVTDKTKHLLELYTPCLVSWKEGRRFCCP